MKSALLYFLCELCFLDERTIMVPVGDGGEVLDAAVALKTGCVCLDLCVSSETVEPVTALLSAPRCLTPTPLSASSGLLAPPSFRCTHAIKLIQMTMLHL